MRNPSPDMEFEKAKPETPDSDKGSEPTKDADASRKTAETVVETKTEPDVGGEGPPLVTIAEGGIIGGGQIRLCLENVERDLVGLSFAGSGLRVVFLSVNRALVNDRLYEMEADAFCYIRLKSRDNAEDQRVFLISYDRLKLTDETDSSIVLHQVGQ